MPNDERRGHEEQGDPPQEPPVTPGSEAAEEDLNLLGSGPDDAAAPEGGAEESADDLLGLRPPTEPEFDLSDLGVPISPTDVARSMDEFIVILHSLNESVVPVLTEKGEELAGELRPIISGALQLALGLAGDVSGDLESEISRLSAAKAKRQRNYFEHLVGAGFTEGQAFKLLLASVKSISFTESVDGSAVLKALKRALADENDE